MNEETSILFFIAYKTNEFSRKYVSSDSQLFQMEELA